jgi:hypothetical protein
MLAKTRARGLGELAVLPGRVPREKREGKGRIKEQGWNYGRGEVGSEPPPLAGLAMCTYAKPEADTVETGGLGADGLKRERMERE